ncbi:MAG: AAA family ATPase [Patescibacteria group bacterium]
MIYLIGGPPRSGKTTLAKFASKKLGIPWISCDTLEVIAGAYMGKQKWNKTHP